jgi:hypothetical protein
MRKVFLCFASSAYLSEMFCESLCVTTYILATTSMCGTMWRVDQLKSQMSLEVTALLKGR